MKPFPVMVNMELSDEEKLDCSYPIATPRGPDYPYGLHISLTEKELSKLGLDVSMATVGGMFHGHFMACITSVSLNDGPEGQCERVEAQIQNLAIESEDEENEEMDASGDKRPSRRSALYGKAMKDLG